MGEGEITAAHEERCDPFFGGFEIGERGEDAAEAGRALFGDGFGAGPRLEVLGHGDGAGDEQVGRARGRTTSWRPREGFRGAAGADVGDGVPARARRPRRMRY